MQNTAYNVTAIHTGSVSALKANSSNNVPNEYAYVAIFEDVITWIIFFFGLPAISLASYALYRLIRADHVAPIYVINLLISDFVQIIVRVGLLPVGFLDPLPPAYFVARLVIEVVVRFGIVASLGFMVCISLERYLVVVHPLWYRYHRNIRHTLMASLAVWLLATIYAAIDYNVFRDQITFSLVFSILFLLPAPVLVFLYVGTRRALASTIGVSNREKKRILGVLAMVLAIYAVLFLPFIISSCYLLVIQKKTLTSYCLMAIGRSIVRMSPLVDPFLYIFMRKSVKDTVEAFPCCRRLISAGQSWSRSSTDQEETRADTRASDKITGV